MPVEQWVQPVPGVHYLQGRGFKRISRCIPCLVGASTSAGGSICFDNNNIMALIDCQTCPAQCIGNLGTSRGVDQQSYNEIKYFCGGQPDYGVIVAVRYCPRSKLCWFRVLELLCDGSGLYGGENR